MTAYEGWRECIICDKGALGLTRVEIVDESVQEMTRFRVHEGWRKSKGLKRAHRIVLRLTRANEKL